MKKASHTILLTMSLATLGTGALFALNIPNTSKMEYHPHLSEVHLEEPTTKKISSIQADLNKKISTIPEGVMVGNKESMKGNLGEKTSIL